MSGPITKPMAWGLLEIFGIKKDANQFISTLGQQVVPMVDVMSFQRQDNTSNDALTIGAGAWALGPNTLWTNNTGYTVRIARARISSSAALGAAITLQGFVYGEDTKLGSNPAQTILSLPRSYTTGQAPHWALNLLDNEVFVLDPGGRLAIWMDSYAGPNPAMVGSVEYQILSA